MFITYSVTPIHVADIGYSDSHRVCCTRIAANYVLFILGKILDAKSKNYADLITECARQWKPDTFIHKLPDAAVLVWNFPEPKKLPVQSQDDIRALVGGGDALRNHPIYNSLISRYVRNPYPFFNDSTNTSDTYREIPQGYMDNFNNDVLDSIREASAGPARTSRKILRKCKKDLEGLMKSFNCYAAFYET